MGKHVRSLWRGAKIGYWKPYNKVHRKLTTKTFNYDQKPDDEPDIFLYAAIGVVALYGIERYRRKP